MSREILIERSIDYLDMHARGLPTALSEVCKKVVRDPRFQEGFGAHHIHHAYKGGLPVHTAEVLKYALSMDERADPVVLKTAAIVHDYFKIYDYREVVDGAGGLEIVKTEYRAKIRHLVGSYGWFYHQMALVDKERLPQVEAIYHCLISHHGRREWGAAQEPQTLEAAILHYADMLSAGYGIGK